MSETQALLTTLAAKYPVKEPRVDSAKVHWTPLVDSAHLRDKFFIRNKVRTACYTVGVPKLGEVRLYRVRRLASWRTWCFFFFCKTTGRSRPCLVRHGAASVSRPWRHSWPRKQYCHKVSCRRRHNVLDVSVHSAMWQKVTIYLSDWTCLDFRGQLAPARAPAGAGMDDRYIFFISYFLFFGKKQNETTSKYRWKRVQG